MIYILYVKKEVINVPRDAKPINLTNARYSNKHKIIREEIEKRLASGGTLIEPAPLEWPDQRKAIYDRICSILRSSGMLAGLDKFTIMQACIIIDRVRQIDALIDKQGVADKELRICRSDYFKQYMAIASILCLTPSARLKVNSLITDNQKQEQDPLLKALKASQK